MISIMIDLLAQNDWPFPSHWRPEIWPNICWGGFCFLWIVLFVLWIAIAIWMYKDAEKRGENGALWVLIWLVGSIVGLIIWLVVRPSMYEVRRKKQMEREYYRRSKKYEDSPQKKEEKEE
ncbi:MAG: hypothetical protein ACOC85_01705 [Thermoplasmatota archaeon]